MTLTGRHFRITGRVQGVGFRHFTWRAANEIGLVGWVRNRRDGSVEAEAWGLSDQLEQFRRRVNRGPRFSRVDVVEEQLADGPTPTETEFAVRPTR